MFAVDRQAELLAEAHAGRDGIRTVAQDLTGEDAPRAVVAFGAVDILFNNAGTSANSLAEAMTDAQWGLVLDVNLRSMFQLVCEAIPALKRQAESTGRARILNTSSVMARDTDIGLSAYTASKHGVAGLTKTLALELGKFGITRNHILPGAIVTGLTQRSFEQAQITGSGVNRGRRAHAARLINCVPVPPPAAAASRSCRWPRAHSISSGSPTWRCSPRRSTTTALTTSPRRGSRAAITQASCTDGCRCMRLSTSAGQTLKPEALIIRLSRSTMNR